MCDFGSDISTVTSFSLPAFFVYFLFVFYNTCGRAVAAAGCCHGNLCLFPVLSVVCLLQTAPVTTTLPRDRLTCQRGMVQNGISYS